MLKDIFLIFTFKFEKKIFKCSRIYNMVITIFTVTNNVKSRDPIGSKNSPNVVLRVGGDTEVSDGVSCGKPL